MTEHPSKLLLQTLDRAQKVLYEPEVSVSPCTETRTPLEVRRSDPIWWNAVALEWATAKWSLLLTDSDAFFEAYPHIREYHKLTGVLRSQLERRKPRDDEGPTWADWPAHERVDEFQ